jgi:hypothetical protein
MSYVAKPMTRSQLIAGSGERISIKEGVGAIHDLIAQVVYKEAKNSFTLPAHYKLFLFLRKAGSVEIKLKARPSRLRQIRL